jgi:hypothetical protein
VKTPYPPPTRIKVGSRQFRIIPDLTTITTQECIIMAARSTKKKTNPKANDIEDTELEELEALEELDDLDDIEDEVDDAEGVTSDDDDDDDEDDTDEDDDTDPDTDDDIDLDDEDDTPPPAKAKKGKSNKSKAKPSRSRTTDGMVGTAEIAEAAGVDSRTLRMVLRKHSVPKDEETGRYEWPSLNHKQVKQILKWIKAGEADNIKQDAFNKLKERKAAKEDEAPATKGKKDKAKKDKVKKNKKSKRVVVEDDDE